MKLMNLIYNLGIVFVIAYLIGSIPTGYIIVKAKTGKDIREVGSGSTGATNVKRVLGTPYFFIVMLLDALKGAIPVILATILISYKAEIGLPPVVASIAVILGHSKPLFLGFKGGKSVATGVGTILALNFVVGIIVAVIWSAITYTSKYVSLGSIIAVTCAPILMFLFHQPIAYTVYCAIGAIYIIYLHRENVRRLIKGEENKVRK
jgi:glycerol-3-phosphate acyltransferase PlsY